MSQLFQYFHFTCVCFFFKSFHRNFLFSKNCFVNIDNAKFVEIQKNTTVNIAGRDVTFFAMTHSAGDNVGISINTSKGNIVYSSDFIFDFNAGRTYACDLALLNIDDI